MVGRIRPRRIADFVCHFVSNQISIIKGGTIHSLRCGTILYEIITLNLLCALSHVRTLGRICRNFFDPRPSAPPLISILHDRPNLRDQFGVMHYSVLVKEDKLIIVKTKAKPVRITLSNSFNDFESIRSSLSR